MAPLHYPNFPSKLLLFGEHIVLYGANALAVPYPRYSLSFSENKSNRFFDLLESFYQYALHHPSFIDRIDCERFESLLPTLAIESDIPIGYGLGSSGAFVAAFYDQFVVDKKTDFISLKTDLASLESYFHGKSSGVDPLVSYTRHHFLIQSEQIHPITLSFELAPKIELVDSDIPREGKEAIALFRSMMHQKPFEQMLYQEMIPLNNRIISQMIEGNVDFDDIIKLSALQFEHYLPLIPIEMRQEWRAGLDSGTYATKLCGAGMGGMFLRFLK